MKQQNSTDLTNIRDLVTKSKIQSLIEMDIILSDATPISMKPKRMSQSEKLEIDKQIEKWLKNDIIQVSHSDFAANLVIVPKVDGTKRLCVDFRRLNKQIIRDHFPISNA